MTETRPVQSAQPATGTSPRAPDQRQLQQDAAARFRQALTQPASAPLDQTNSVAAARGEAGRDHIQTEGFAASARLDPNLGAAADAERRDSNAALLNSDLSDLANAAAANSERRECNSLTSGMPATVGSLYYSLPFNQASAEPAMAPAGTAEAAQLIEQATSVLMERASRSDASRFIVSLDHAIVGGASAEFIRDGAFLHVRLLARNDAAYRSMWTHRAELEERLGASTGLVTRVEILEGYGDGRSA